MLARRQILRLLLGQTLAFGAASDVPFVGQSKHACGAAAVAMVMQYWARQKPADVAAADPRAIEKALIEPRRKGIAGSSLASYLNQRGFNAFAISADYADLREHLARGRPVIVCLQPGGRNAPLHYIVVLAIDQESGRLLVHDPARGPSLNMAFADFDRAWRRTDRWALVATPK